MKISVVDADIPLLLGLDYQTEWGMVIYLGIQEIYIRGSKNRIKKGKEKNLWTLPIQRNAYQKDKDYDNMRQKGIDSTNKGEPPEKDYKEDKSWIKEKGMTKEHCKEEDDKRMGEGNNERAQRKEVGKNRKTTTTEHVKIKTNKKQLG